MDEQLEKIQACLEELEKQIKKLEEISDKPAHYQQLVRHANESFIPSMKASIYKTKTLESRLVVNEDAEKQGLISLARYEAFSTFYSEMKNP